MNFNDSPRQEVLDLLPDPGLVVRVDQIVELSNGLHRVSGTAVEGVIVDPAEIQFTPEQAKRAGCVAVAYAAPGATDPTNRLIQVKSGSQIVDTISPYRLHGARAVHAYIIPGE